MFGTWCASACEPREALHALLRRGVARAVVRDLQNEERSRDGKPDFPGWAAVVVKDPQVVVWAYTKPRGRRDGNMVALLMELGTDLTREMRAVYWSPACDGLISKGWPIRYLTADERAELYR